MKVLYVVPSLNVSKFKGLARYSYEIYRRLKEKIDIEVFEVYEPRKNYFSNLTTVPLRQLLSRADVIHSLVPENGSFLWLISKIKNVKSIVTFHDIIPLEFPDDLKFKLKEIVKLYTIFTWKNASKANIVVAQSSQTAEDVRRIFGRKVDAIIFPGIDKKFKPKKVKKDKITLGFFANYSYRKGLDKAVEVFKIVKQKYDVKLIIAGGKLQTIYQRQFNPFELTKGLKDVEILGEVPEEKVVDLYNSFDFYLFPSLVEGFGIPCLPGNSLIITKEGLKRIKEIRIGDEVLTHRGRFKKVIQTFVREYRGKLVRIVPYCFSPISLTPEHPVLVVKRQKKSKKRKKLCWGMQRPKWIPAKEIKKRDVVLFPIPLQASSLKIIDLKSFDKDLKYNKRYVWYEMSYSPVTKKILKFKRFIRIDKNFAKLIGYFIAEGSINKNQPYCVEFSFGNEPEYVSEVIRLMKKVFGIRYATLISKKNCKRVIFSGKVLAKLFSKLCGESSRNKRIPPELLYGDVKLLKHVIKGIWNGDGSKIGNKISFSISSKQLVNDLKIALLRLGFKPQIVRYKRRGRTEYLVNCMITNRKNYVHSNKSWFIKEYLGLLVKKVSLVPFKGRVYNLEVEEDNSYTTESFVVHNCLEAQACGIPTLVFEWAKIPKEVTEKAIKCKDVKDMAEKIMYLIENRDEYLKIRREGIKYAKKFDWDKSAKMYLELYEK